MAYILSQRVLEKLAEWFNRWFKKRKNGDADANPPGYRKKLLSVDEDRSAAAFVVVPGATITASGEPGETVNVSTEVSVDSASFTYEREVTVGDNGQLAVTVPYAGEYSIGSNNINVTETDVLGGTTVRTTG